MASCCPSCSTSPRIAHSCLCSTQGLWSNWRGRRPPTRFPFIATGTFFPARLDLGGLVADIPARIQGRSVTRAAALHMILALPRFALLERDELQADSANFALK